MSTSSRPVPLPFVSKVVGVQPRQDVVRQVVEDDLLWVEHDPANPYDSNACAVKRWDGTLVGFIPKEIAARLVAREESKWQARVTEVLRGETWGLRIRVAHDAHENVPEPDENDPYQRSGARVLPGAGRDESSAPRSERRDLPALTGTDPTRVLAALLAEGRDEVAPAVKAGPVRSVRARSGRVLGVFVSEDAGKIVVRNPEGHELAYPAGAVRVDAES